MADDYKHGEMDITEQEKTFAGFMSWTSGTLWAILVVLILLAIFAT